MQRDRVVDLRADMALSEELAQGVAAGGADHVLVPDMTGAGKLVGQHDSAAWAMRGVRSGLDQSGGMKECVIAPGDGAAGMIPAVDVLELDAENRALEAVHAGVPADFVVVVAAAHAVLAQHPGTLGQLVGVGCDHAGVARRAQILGGIKAEGGRIAEAAGFYALPLRAPGLGGVFDELEPVRSFRDGQRPSNRRTGRRDARAGCALTSAPRGPSRTASTADGVEVEGGRVDVGQQRRGPGAEDGADRGEEAEGSGDDGRAGADSGGGQGQPESVGARGAAHGVGHAQLDSGGFFKGGYRIAENELLRLKHLPDRVQQLLVERAVLAFEVQHGHRLGGCGWASLRIRRGVHNPMLAAEWLSRSQNRNRETQCMDREKPKIRAEIIIATKQG